MWYNSPPPTIHKTIHNKLLCGRRLSHTSVKLYQVLYLEYYQTLGHLLRGSCKDKMVVDELFLSVM
jgi:hypothetical protein